MAHFKLLLNSLIITVAMAFSADNDSKNNSQFTIDIPTINITAMNITTNNFTSTNIAATVIKTTLAKPLEPLIYKIEFYDFTPKIMTSDINKNYCKKTDVHTMIKQYNEEQQAKYGFIYTAMSIIDVLINSQMKTIRLHILNLQTINERQTILVCTDKNKNSTSHIRPDRYLFNKTEHTVVLEFGYHILFLLNISIKMDFIICKLHVLFYGNTDNQDSEGILSTSYIDGMKRERHWLTAVNNFQGIGVRQVFPCYNETTIETKFQIRINHEKKYTILSNGNVQMGNCSYKDNRDDMLWTEIHFTEIPSYLLTFIVSDLPLLSSKYGTYMWGRQLASLELKFAWDIVANVTFRSKEMWYNNCSKTDVLNISEKWHEKCDEASKVRISLMKLNHVAIPNFRDEGIRSFGLVYYSEAAIIYNETLDTIACKIKVAQIVARKTVLLLFGNMTPLPSWSHLWLNEGIVTFIGMYIVDQVIPHFQMMDLFVVQIQHELFYLDSYYDAPLIVETDKLFNFESLSSLTRYLKAPVFMRMLQHVMTYDSFLLGLNLYLERQFNIVKNDSSDISKLTFDNFWIAMTTSFERTHKSEFDLKNKFDNWMIQGHYPVLNVTREYKEKDNHIIIKLLQKESYSNNWSIPVTYTTKTNYNFTKTSPDYWLEPQMPSLIVPLEFKYDWVIVNIQQAGYYRVNYDWKNWELIATYLNNQNHTRIHVLNRAQIIDDSFHFLLKGQLPFLLFRKITDYLFKETDYVAWYPMFKILERLSVLKLYNVFGLIEHVIFKMSILQNLNRLLDEIGYEETPFENPLTVSLRQEAAKWACTLGSSTCKETATQIILNQISKNRLQNLLPGWQHWTNCNGLRIVKTSTWYKMYVLHQNISSNILEFLTCSENSNIITSYVTFLLARMSSNIDEKLKNSYINSFFSIIAKHSKTDAVLSYLLENFHTIISKSKISEITVLTSIINHVYSIKQINKITNFLNENVNITKDYITLIRLKLEKTGRTLTENIATLFP